MFNQDKWRQVAKPCHCIVCYQMFNQDKWRQVAKHGIHCLLEGIVCPSGKRSICLNNEIFNYVKCGKVGKQDYSII